MRRHGFVWWTGWHMATVGLFLSVTGCLDEPTTALSGSTPLASVTKKETKVKPGAEGGKDFFRGFIFGVGPVADEVPSLRNFRLDGRPEPDSVKAVGHALANEVVEIIDSLQPNFFKNFSKMMRSGNPIVVERSVKQAARIALSSMKHLTAVRQLRDTLKNDPSLKAKFKEYLHGQPTGLGRTRANGSAATMAAEASATRTAAAASSDGSRVSSKVAGTASPLVWTDDEEDNELIDAIIDEFLETGDPLALFYAGSVWYVIVVAIAGVYVAFSLSAIAVRQYAVIYMAFAAAVVSVFLFTTKFVWVATPKRLCTAPDSDPACLFADDLDPFGVLYQSAMAEAADFYADEEIDGWNLSVTIYGQSAIDGNTSCQWQAYASGGEGPYTYQWRVNNSPAGTNSEYIYIAPPSGSPFTLSVLVTDANYTTKMDQFSVGITPGTQCQF